jgi:hypothetical protein
MLEMPMGCVDILTGIGQMTTEEEAVMSQTAYITNIPMVSQIHGGQ